MLKRELESDYMKFVQYAFLKQNKRQFIVNSHHRDIASHMVAVHDGEKRNSVVNIAPRYSKTSMCVIFFVAWSFAKNPKCKFIHLSYSEGLVFKNSTEIRDIIASDWFQELWPIEFKKDSNAKNEWTTSQGGTFYAAPTAGQVTGRGAGAADINDDIASYDWLEKYNALSREIEIGEEGFNGCFVAGTLVETIDGPKRIESIRVGDLVSSYNHKTETLEYKKVEAIREKKGNDFTTIKTRSGSEITATSDHRFFDGERYKQIAEFNRGDSVFKAISQVSKLPDSVLEAQIRAEKSSKTTKRSAANLLLKRVFSRVYKKAQNRLETREKRLSNMQGKISTSESFNYVLLKGLRKLVAFKKNEGREQSKLQGLTKQVVENGFVQQDALAHSRERWGLCSVWNKGESTSASYRQEPREQCAREFGDDVQDLSCRTPQVASDTISELTRDSSREQLVYDLQVEGNHNFFTEGILVHNCILIDDPNKPSDCDSTTMLEKVNSKLNNTVMSRRNSPKKTPILIVMQRLHENDMTGYVLDGGTGEEWHHLCLPALYIDDNGEEKALWEQKHTLEDLKSLERADTKMFAGQYKQLPAPEDGELFKRQNWEIVDAVPDGGSRVRGYDLAASTGKDSAATASCLIQKVGQTYYILNVQEDRLLPADVNKNILMNASIDGKRVKISLPQDPGQAGKSQAAYMVGMLTGYIVEATIESGSKEERAKAPSSQQAVGNIKLLRGDWNKKFIEQATMFPNGKFKDMIDALSRAFHCVNEFSSGEFDDTDENDDTVRVSREVENEFF